MTTETPPDWVLLEAAKRVKWETRDIEILRQHQKWSGGAFSALCDMIQKHEKPPVDRKVLCARQASAETYTTIVEEYRQGKLDHLDIMRGAIRAIELWEEGFGK